MSLNICYYLYNFNLLRMVFIRKIKSKIRGRFKANVLKQCSEISPQKMPDRSTEPEPPKSAGPARNKVQNQKFCRISTGNLLQHSFTTLVRLGQRNPQLGSPENRKFPERIPNFTATHYRAIRHNILRLLYTRQNFIYIYIYIYIYIPKI